MAGDTEKTEHGSHPASSHGYSTDGNESTRKHRVANEKNGRIPSESPENMNKLDSAVKVEVKDHDVFAHLPKHEADILRKQVDTPNVKSGWRTLYRYSTNTDMLIIAICGLCSIAAGAALPLMTIIFGGLAGEFNNYFAGLTSYSDFQHTISHM